MATSILLAGPSLLVDVRGTLLDLGYEVPAVAAHDDELLLLCEQIEPSLAIIDVRLEGAGDGVDAAREVKSRIDVPVILAGVSDDATLQRALRVAPHGYLSLPFDERQLRTAVEVALHKHQLDGLLPRRERWFAASVRDAGEALVAIDGDGLVTSLNAAAASLARGAAAGRPIEEVFHVVDARGRPPGRRVRVHAVDRFHVAAGDVVCFSDVTERRRRERRLAAAERQAALGTLVAGMAHAINSPLAAIIANSSMCADDVAGALAALDRGDVGDARAMVREVADMLGDSVQAGHRLKDLVGDVRTLLRHDAATEILDLPRVLEGARRAVADRLGAAAVTARYATTPYVEASEPELTQAFAQLVTNAAEALPGGAGTIAIRAYTDDAGRAVAEIEDDGAGIPVHVLGRIFEPFFTTRQPGGKGLGLTLCRRIVTDLGGDIGVESAEGKGTVARVVLPPARRPQPAPIATRRKRLLVIDDEPSVARVIARVLGREHDVVVETDPRAALARLASDSAFDLVFCDLHMPELSGRDVYEAVTAANARMRGRFVFVTGSADRDDPFLRGVPSPVILKPFGVDAIRGVVEDLLR